MSPQMQINYAPSPTLFDFHMDRAFVRGVMGPIGSGKSVGMCMEVFKLSTEQAPDAMGRRRTRWAIIRNCYDDKTEVLTENGWKLFRDLLEDERVAQLNDDGYMEFVHPSYYYQKQYDGEMIGFRNEGANFLVTPDHNMLVSRVSTRKKVWGEYKFKHASEVYGSRSYRVMRDAKWVGTDPKRSVSFFRWLGFWYAEGTCGVYGGRHQLVITQDPDRYDVESLFVDAGLPYSVSDRPGKCMTYRLSVTKETRALIKCLSLVGKSHNKSVPDWIKNAPKDHLCAFINGFIDGDGHHRGNSRTAYTSSKCLADDLQEIALRAGQVANVSDRDRRGKKFVINGIETTINHIEYTVSFLTTKKYRPILHSNKKMCSQDYGWYKEEYHGKVYCIEVPTHKIYVRREGKAMWCSQTYPELTSTTLNTWKEWIPEHICKLKYGSPITGHMRFPLGDGTTVDAEIYFLALDKPRDVKKLLSLEITGSWVNEVREISKAAIDMLTGRVGRFPRMADGGPTWRGIIMDTNPCDDDHWYYNLAEKEKPYNYRFFRQPGAMVAIKDAEGRTVDYRANPKAENINNLDGRYAYYSRQIPGKDPDWIKVYIMGEYGSLFEGKPVYQNIWNDLTHVATDSLACYRGIPLVLGWDFGLTPACIVGQVTPRGGVNILREYICEDGGIREFANNMVKPALFNEFPGCNHMSYGDPAGNQRSQVDETTCIQELNKAGFPCMATMTNAFLARRQAVTAMLGKLADGKPAFQLDPSCQVLRKGFNGGYKFDRVQVSGDERYRDVPCKNAYSHPHDALQYLMLGVEHPMTAESPNRPPAHPDTASTVAWDGLT